MRNWQSHGKLGDPGEVGGVMRSLHHDQEAWVCAKHRRSSPFRGPVPVPFGVVSAPGSAIAQFIAKICSDYPLLLAIALRDRCPVSEPAILGKLSAVPQSI